MNILKNQQGNSTIIITIISSIVLLIIIPILLFGGPIYKVWQQEKSGQAKLAKASQERQILVEQAKAEDEAADYVVNAIRKVGAAAKEFPEYRQQVFMQAYAEALQNESISKIIYVATEAGIPIIEANRLK